MRNEHIIRLIDDVSIASLSESELAAIRSHTAECADCRKAYDAAQVSSLLLKERVVETFEPSPFFQTRVMAMLRERQAASEANEAWGLSRLWRSAGVLASSMAASVALLAVLTFAIPGGSQDVSAVNGYSAEDVILNQAAASEDFTSDNQVLRTLYDVEEEAAN